MPTLLAIGPLLVRLKPDTTGSTHSKMSWRVVATLVLTAWGALAFGAVYPWAFTPLFVGCAVVGGATFLQHTGTGKTEAALAVALALLVAAIGLQLVPVSVGSIRWISPETDVVLRRYAISYPASRVRYPLSIEPRATMLGLAAAGVLSVLLLGLARSLTRDDTLHIARGVSILGVILAVAGIVQKAMWNGKIYGFWTPIHVGDPFGPFVNKNHFAGWMLMALPLAVGYFCARVARGMRQVKPGWRNHLIWFSSADASETILVGFAVLLMALALILTMSRSGILGLLAALVISGWFIARRQAAGSRRTIAAGYLVFVVLVAAGWTGFDRIVARFTQADVVDVGGRLGIWGDTWRMAGQFPITGTGLNTYGAAMLFYQTADLKQHFAQAHNDYLQLLAEGGTLLCIPAALVVLAFAWTVHRRFREVSVQSSDYWIRIGAVTGILAIAVQELSDFSLQMPGNAVLFVVLLALAVRHPTPGRRIPGPAR
jgi:O-antigen ligase